MVLEPLGTGSVVRLRGEITINSAAELHRLLLAALDTDSEIGVDLSEVKELDLSAIQLFCAAQQAAIRTKRRLSISGDLPQLAVEAFQLAGINPFSLGAES